MCALKTNMLLLYIFLASGYTLASPIMNAHISFPKRSDVPSQQTPYLRFDPVCFTPQFPPFPDKKPIVPTADDCKEVGDGYREEDTRREEYQKVSFGLKKFWDEGQVDFRTPMAKQYHSCYGGITLAPDHEHGVAWEYMRIVAARFEYLQAFCSTRGNLGGGVSSAGGLAWLLYGIDYDTDFSTVNNTAIWETLLAGNKTVVQDPEKLS